MTLDELRAFCLGLPGSREKETWGDAENPGHPTFRVGERIYVIASIGSTHISVRTTLDEQADLMDAFPDAVRPASHTGRYGWVDLDLDRLDPGIARGVVESAWRRLAPKAVVAASDGGAT